MSRSFCLALSGLDGLRNGDVDRSGNVTRGSDRRSNLLVGRSTGSGKESTGVMKEAGSLLHLKRVSGRTRGIRVPRRRGDVAPLGEFSRKRSPSHPSVRSRDSNGVGDLSRCKSLNVGDLSRCKSLKVGIDVDVLDS